MNSLAHRLDPNRYYQSDSGSNGNEWYSTFSKSSGQDTHNQRQFSVISSVLTGILVGRVLPSVDMQSAYFIGPTDQALSDVCQTYTYIAYISDILFFATPSTYYQSPNCKCFRGFSLSDDYRLIFFLKSNN